MTPFFLRIAAAALLAHLCLPALADPVLGDDFRRNGALSRHTWTPGFASVEVAGMQISPGVAFGLSDPLRRQLGSSAAPALMLRLGPRSNLSLLGSANRGAMVVWQATN